MRYKMTTKKYKYAYELSPRELSLVRMKQCNDTTSLLTVDKGYCSLRTTNRLPLWSYREYAGICVGIIRTEWTNDLLLTWLDSVPCVD